MKFDGARERVEGRERERERERERVGESVCACVYVGFSHRGPQHRRSRPEGMAV